MENNSFFQPLSIRNSDTLLLTDIANETPINRLVATIKIYATVTNSNSNIRSIDLLEQITNKFNEIHDIENKIGSFYQAIDNINNDSVNDNNYYEQNKKVENDTNNLSILELIENDIEI